MVSTLLFLIAVALAMAVWLAIQPDDLRDIGGYGRDGSPQARDLHAVLKSSLDRSYSATLTESEINDWIAETLQPRQDGPLASDVTIRRVWVRLDEKLAELIMEREAFGRRFTTSIFLRVEEVEDKSGQFLSISYDGGPYLPFLAKPPCGGKIGRLRVPQGFLILTLPAWKKLADAFAPELDLVQRMAVTKIEKHRISFDPNPPLPSSETFEAVPR